MSFNRNSKFKYPSHLFLASSLAVCALALPACRWMAKPVVENRSQALAATAVADPGMQVSLFFQGQDRPGSLESVLDQAIASVDLFSQHVQGAKPGRFSPDELRNLVQNYFLRGAAVSDALMHEVLELKVVLLGGNATELTHAELQAARELIVQFKALIPELRPLLPLTPARAGSLSEEELDRKLTAFAAFADKFALLIQNSLHPYAISRFEGLLRAYAGLSSESSPLVENLLTQLPLIRAAKAALIDHDSETVQPQHWAYLIRQGAGVYSLLMRLAQLQASGQDWFQGPGNRRLSRVALDAVAVLRNSVLQHPNQKISLAEIDTLLDRLPTLPLPITIPTLKQTLRPLVMVLFGDAKDSKPRADDGLTLAAVDRIQDAVALWGETQRLNEALFTAGQNTTLRQSVLLSIDPEKALDQEIVPGSLSARAAEFLKNLIQERRDRTLFRDDSSQIYYAQERERTLTQIDLTHKIWMRIVADALFRAYAVNGRGGYPEFTRFYWDFRQIQVEMKLLFDPHIEDLLKGQFQEATLFSYSANGDEWLEPVEIMHHLAKMMSSKQLSTRTHLEISKSCASYGTDTWGMAILDSACFQKQFFANVDSYWDHMPGLLAYYKGLDEDQKQDFQARLYGAAFGGVEHPKLSSLLTQNYSLIAHYLEALVVKFDLNNNSLLEHHEGTRAFPSFEGLIRDAVPSTKDLSGTLLRSAFLYILKYGEIPSTPEFLGWAFIPRRHKSVATDRTIALRIFEALAQAQAQINKAKVASAADRPNP